MSEMHARPRTVFEAINDLSSAETTLADAVSGRRGLLALLKEQAPKGSVVEDLSKAAKAITALANALTACHEPTSSSSASTSISTPTSTSAHAAIGLLASQVPPAPSQIASFFEHVQTIATAFDPTAPATANLPSLFDKMVNGPLGKGMPLGDVKTAIDIIGDAFRPRQEGGPSIHDLIVKVVNGPLDKDSPPDAYLTALKTIAAAADHWRTCIADQPRDVKVAGRVCAEVEQIVVLAECRALSPQALTPLLGLLHQLESGLAGIGLDHNRAQELTASYLKTIGQIDSTIAGSPDLKGLKPLTKRLQMKAPSGTREEMQAHLAQQLRQVHEFTATALAHCAAHAPRMTVQG